MRRRPSLFFLLCCLLVIVAGGMSSLQDLLKTPAEGGCEYCDLAANQPRWLPPLGLAMPSLLLDLAPETLLPLLLPAVVPPPRQAMSSLAQNAAVWMESDGV